MAKKEIEFKTWLTLDEMVKYLGDLATCLGQGKVVLQRGGEFLEFCPAQSMELELEGVHKKGQQKISIEMSWRQVVMEPLDEPLKISPDSPPPQLQAAAAGTQPEAPVTAEATGAPIAAEVASAPIAAEEPAKGKSQRQAGK